MGRYNSRDLVWVTPFTGSDIKYGFRTNVDDAVRSILGHVPVEGAFPVGLVIGANSPKPPRASRRRAAGYQSSFCSASAVVAARENGFSVRPGRSRSGRVSRLSATVYVTVEGNKLAWNMPIALYSRILDDDLAGLGIRLATPADDDLIFGVSYPRRPRATRIEQGTDGQDVISTFVDPSNLNNLPDGWAAADTGQDRF